MKKRISLISPIILILFLVGAVSTSCGKVQGCTDASAKNFSTEAEEDDGSCTYEGEIIFWYMQSVSSSLSSDGITSLAYYVEGELVGSSAASVFHTSSPDCGANGTVTVTRDLGSAKSKQYVFRVIDSENDEIVWEGTLNFKANTCTALQLTN